MSTSPEHPRHELNVDLFQVQKVQQTLHISRGISVNVGPNGRLFVDPQLELDNPDSYGPAAAEDLVLGIEEFGSRDVMKNGLACSGALPVADDDRHLNIAEPLGSHRLTRPAAAPIGRAALLGIAEHRDLMVINTYEGLFGQTRLLHEAQISTHNPDERIGFAAKLILLSGTGYVDISWLNDTSANVSRLRYDDKDRLVHVQNIRKNNDDEGGDEGYGGGNSYDPEPRIPHDPMDKGAIELDIPREEHYDNMAAMVPAPLVA